MSVIQTIRNKYIGIVVGAIVVALLGFLVMDAMQSNVRSVFSGDQTLLASINGTRIEAKDFEMLRNKYEENMKSREKGKTLSDEERNQASEQAWSDIINETLVGEESDKLGLSFTDKELQDMLTGPYADPMIQQSFADPNTGIFDPSRVNQYLNTLGQDKTGAERAKWRDFEDAIIKTRKITKYNDMIIKGIYVPSFVVKQMGKDNSALSAINYVQIPYASINDSSVNVTDADITEFMKKNEKLFLTLEATARAEYVTFDIIPSSADTAESLGQLNSLKEAFAATTDNEEFIAKNSEESMRDFYYNEKNLEAPVPADIINAAVGSVTGPFYYNDGYKMIKILDKKQMPDSVKASHILLAITEQRTEEQAKAGIDSMLNMVNSGADFAQLAAARSDDQNSGKKGGDLGYVPQGVISTEFSDACFNGKTGDVKIAKSQYGYHLVKITDQKDFKPSVKIAVVSKVLQAGTATTQAAFAKANEFVAQAKDSKSFNEAAKKMGKDKRIADRITKTQSLIMGLGSARDLSRWMYEAKIGAVSPIFNMDDKCIVANLVSRQEKGTMPDVASVRPQIENLLKNQKKAKVIAEKYKGKGLEEIASATQTQIMSADTLTYAQGNAALQSEPKVIGAAFDKNLTGKVSGGIGGEQGVYFISVKNITAGTEPDATMQMIMRRQAQQQMTQQATQMISFILKRNAKIDDRRSNFF